MDHNQTVQHLQERYSEYGQHLFLSFVDYEHVFDSVKFPSVLSALDIQRVSRSHIRLLKEIYEDSAVQELMDRRSENMKLKNELEKETVCRQNFSVHF